MDQIRTGGKKKTFITNYEWKRYFASLSFSGLFRSEEYKNEEGNSTKAEKFVIKEVRTFYVLEPVLEGI